MEWTETWSRAVESVVPVEATHLGLIVFDNKGQIRGRIPKPPADSESSNLSAKSSTHSSTINSAPTHYWRQEEPTYELLNAPNTRHVAEVSSTHGSPRPRTPDTGADSRCATR